MSKKLFKNLFQKNAWRWRRGTSIVEILIATGVVALVMTAIVSVLTVSVMNTARAKARALATKYAQEGIEYFRQQRAVLGWDTLKSTVQQSRWSMINATVYCLPAQLPDTITSLTKNMCTDTNQNVDPKKLFRREASVRVIGSTIRVSVSVSWADGSKTSSTTLTQELRQY